MKLNFNYNANPMFVVSNLQFENGCQVFKESKGLSSFDENLSYLKNGTEMFMNSKDLKSFSSNISSLQTSDKMFYGCDSLESFSPSDSESTIITSADQMFAECPNLTDVDIIFPKVENAVGMFSGCSSLKTLNFGGTPLYINQMFCGCSAITEVDMDASSAKDGYQTFKNCSSLSSISLDLSSLESGCEMFENTNISNFSTDVPKLSNGNCMFRGCSSLTSFTSDISNIDTADEMFSGCQLDFSSTINILENLKTVENSKIGLSTDTTTCYEDGILKVEIYKGMADAQNKGWALSFNDDTPTNTIKGDIDVLVENKLKSKYKLYADVAYEINSFVFRFLPCKK